MLMVGFLTQGISSENYPHSEPRNKANWNPTGQSVNETTKPLAEHVCRSHFGDTY